MKKIYTINKYKKYHKKCTENRNIRRLSHNKWRANKCQIQQGVSHCNIKERNVFEQEYPGYVKVIAPNVFSFIRNTDKVIKFIETLNKLYNSKQETYVDLSYIEEIDYSAIIVLLSIMVKFKAQKTSFDGNFPLNIEVKKEIIASGFFENLYKEFEDDYSYDISKIN